MTRRVAILIATLAAIPPAAGVIAAQAGIGRDQTLSARPKARTIAELVARYDSTSCVECHQEVHDEWSRSLHARSIFGTGRTAATFLTTIRNGLMEWPASGVRSPRDVGVEHLMGCSRCHLPQLADATDAVAQEIVTTIGTWRTAMDDSDEEAAEQAKRTLSSLNINCLVCHNRNAIVHKWSDGYPGPRTVYGRGEGDHPHPTFTKMGRSAVLSESLFCGQCHGLGPNLDQQNPTQCATAYGSYLFAYVPEGGRATCQSCHMHASKLGHDMQSYRSPVMARAAVDMHVDVAPVLWRDNTSLRPKARVRVDLTNKAGHGIPDG